jgi:hypothetical protein
VKYKAGDVLLYRRAKGHDGYLIRVIGSRKPASRYQVRVLLSSYAFEVHLAWEHQLYPVSKLAKYLYGIEQ